MQPCHATHVLASSDPRRIVRPRELYSLVGMRRSTIDRMEVRGEFPRRIRLGARAVGWRYEEIQAWIESRREDAGGER